MPATPAKRPTMRNMQNPRIRLRLSVCPARRVRMVQTAKITQTINLTRTSPQFSPKASSQASVWFFRPGMAVTASRAPAKQPLKVQG